MRALPETPFLDSTLQMMMDPYRFISKNCQTLQSDCFQTRIFGKSAVCLLGAEAAKIFYDPELTRREGAAPEPLKATLFGKGAIQSLDGRDHKDRKRLLMTFMTHDKMNLLQRIFTQELRDSSIRWEKQQSVVLYDEFQNLLTRVACGWVGVPLNPGDVAHRSHDLTAMFDSASSFGLGHFRSRLARKRSEFWIRNLIVSHRSGYAVFPSDSPAEHWAEFMDSNGHLLTPHEAAVEILNLLRPMTAISVYFLFVVHALNLYPDCKIKIQTNSHFKYLFIEEVRRFYPFFPSVLAKARKDIHWDEFIIPKDTRLILDLYGTNHDPRSWKKPDIFWPERFVTETATPFNFIPQGGGDANQTHRCPGEDPTLILMSLLAEFFSRSLSYELPEQNLEVDFTRTPAIPKSRMVIENVHVASLDPFEFQIRRSHSDLDEMTRV